MTQPTPPATAPSAVAQRLRRSRQDQVLVGVCAGLAHAFDVPALAVRVVALLLVATVPVLALTAYAGLAVAMPRDDGRNLLGGAPPDRRETMLGWTLLVVGLVCLASVMDELPVVGGPVGMLLLMAGGALLTFHHLRTLPAAPPVAVPSAGAATRAPRRHDPPYPGARRGRRRTPGASPPV